MALEYLYVLAGVPALGAAREADSEKRKPPGVPC